MSEKTKPKRTASEKPGGFVVIMSDDCPLGRRGAVIMASPEDAKKETDAKRARIATDNDLKIAGLGVQITNR